MFNSFRQKPCVQNCGQTAADKDMVTIDSVYELGIALFNVPSPTPYDVLFSHNTCVTDDDRRQTDDTSYLRLDPAVRQKLSDDAENNAAALPVVLFYLLFISPTHLLVPFVSRRVADSLKSVAERRHSFNRLSYLQHADDAADEDVDAAAAGESSRVDLNRRLLLLLLL